MAYTRPPTPAAGSTQQRRLRCRQWRAGDAFSSAGEAGNGRQQRSATPVMRCPSMPMSTASAGLHSHFKASWRQDSRIASS